MSSEVPQSTFNCRLCEMLVPVGTRLIAREMMYGTRREFEYLLCSQCGCLQINKVPEDLSSFYRTDYYSFQSNNNRKHFLRRAMRRARLRLALRRALNTGRLGELFTKWWKVPPFMTWLAKAKVNMQSAILDVGSGQGQLLYELREIGFSNLTGVDPFAPEAKQVAGLRIEQKTLGEISGTFDLIMFNHSLEHLPDQKQTLKEAVERLSKDGLILVRVPLSDSYAFEKYGANWVQLDAPRHLYLHTKKSIANLAESCALEIFETIYDSTEFQFWASELYAKDVPLITNGTSANARSLYSQKTIQGFKSMTAQLNKQERGDQAVFFLRKKKI